MTAGGTARAGGKHPQQQGYGGPPTTTTTTATFFSSSPTLPSMHLDFVTDVAFDHYGRRIATCSGDRTVRVWDLDDDGTWTTAGDNDGGVGGTGGANMSEWQAHRGAVTRLSWAHPEFGQLLATCGTDHAATVWEEREGSFLVPGGGGGGGNVSPATASGTQQQQQQGGGGGGGAATRWVAKAQLTDARKAVSCVSFAPRHLGLRIATGSADGLVRIYEAIDVMNLNHWPMQGSIDTSDESPGGGGGGANSTSSTDPRDSTRSAGVGGTGQQRPYSSRGSGGLGGHGQYQQPSSSSAAPPSASSPSSPDELGVTGLSWCPGRFEPPTLAVGTSGGSVRVYRYSDASRTWQSVLTLPGHDGGVLDVAWAPNVGRSYHLIATAGRDDALRLHRLKRLRGVGGEGAAAASNTALELESSQVLTDASGDGGAAPSEVWRVAWNVTGTVLASSGDGGIVRMWKGNFRNEWSVVSEVHGRPSAVVAGVGSSEEEEKEMVTQ